VRVFVALLVAALVAASSPARAGLTEREDTPVPDGSAGFGSTLAITITPDGRWVGFTQAIVSGLGTPNVRTTSHLYVRDRANRQLRPVDVASDGTPGDDNVGTNFQDFAITADGRCVAFASNATNLVAGDTNHTEDVFLHDFNTGTTERVSVANDGSEANGLSDNAAISDDGRFVAFRSVASNLVSTPHTGPGAGDVFLRDRQNHTTVRVSLKSDGSVGATGQALGGLSMSGDGQRVLFYFQGDDLDLVSAAPGNLFVRDLQATTTRVVGTGNVFALSHDGHFATFSAPDATLVPNDTNGIWDVFVRSLTGNTYERDSVASDGTQATGGGAVPQVSISSDGRYVAFTTDAHIVAGDASPNLSVFLRDRQNGATTRVDVAGDGTPAATAPQSGVAVSDDGCVGFITDAANFDPCTSGSGLFVHCGGTFVTTTTLTCPVTTTTLPGGGTGFGRVQTDLTGLQGLASGRIPAGTFASLIGRLLTKAEKAVNGAAQTSKTKHRRALVKKAATLASKVDARLHSHAATKGVPSDVLPMLQSMADQLKQDLAALRASF
jgi:Tol biopolymer transport system component